MTIRANVLSCHTTASWEGNAQCYLMRREKLLEDRGAIIGGGREQLQGLVVEKVNWTSHSAEVKNSELGAQIRYLSRKCTVS